MDCDWLLNIIYIHTIYILCILYVYILILLSHKFECFIAYKRLQYSEKPKVVSVCKSLRALMRLSIIIYIIFFFFCLYVNNSRGMTGNEKTNDDMDSEWELWGQGGSYTHTGHQGALMILNSDNNGQKHDLFQPGHSMWMSEKCFVAHYYQDTMSCELSWCSLPS